MHVDGRPALSQLFWGPRRVKWLRRQRRQRRRRQPRRKRSSRSTRTSPGYRLRSLRPSQHEQAASFADRVSEQHNQAGPLCRWLLHNGPAFCWDLTRRSSIPDTVAREKSYAPHPAVARQAGGLWPRCIGPNALPGRARRRMSHPSCIESTTARNNSHGIMQAKGNWNRGRTR